MPLTFGWKTGICIYIAPPREKTTRLNGHKTKIHTEIKEWTTNYALKLLEANCDPALNKESWSEVGRNGSLGRKSSSEEENMSSSS